MTEERKPRGRPRKIEDEVVEVKPASVKAPAVARPSMTRKIIKNSGLDPRPYGAGVRD